MANPIPEIMPDKALKAGASIVGTGRSDFPNQINNALVFPAIFRGALDVRAKQINLQMKIAAAKALASAVTPALENFSRLPDKLGTVEKLLADTGYFSAGNVEKCETDDIVPYIAGSRQQHNAPLMERFTEPEPLTGPTDPVAEMTHRLKTIAGKAIYAKRKSTVAAGRSTSVTRASTTSLRLWGGMLVAMPTAMPVLPFSRRFGRRAGRTEGSSNSPL